MCWSTACASIRVTTLFPLVFPRSFQVKAGDDETRQRLLLRTLLQGCYPQVDALDVL